MILTLLLRLLIGFSLQLIPQEWLLPTYGVPGPPVAYLSLILLEISKENSVFSLTFYIILGLFNVVVIVLDYVLPVLGAKVYGATKYGITGSIIGMIAG